MTKKHFLIILILFVLVSCTKQRETYLIKGKIKNIPDSTVVELYEYHDDYGKLIGTDTIINGNFEFEGVAKKIPSKMDISFSDWENYYGSCKFWVDNEVIQILGKNKYPSSWIVKSNNKEQIAFESIRQSTKELMIIGDSLRLLRKQNRENKDLSNRIKKSIDSIGQIRLKLEFDLIVENPNSLSAVEMLYRTAKLDPSVDKKRVKQAYNKLNETYKNSLFGQGIKETFKENEIPEIGDKMINFVAHDTAGINYSLTDFQGKYILLDFWHLGCGPCNAAISETIELHKNNREILIIVGINLISDEKLWIEKSRSEGIPWVNLSDGKGTYAGLSSVYGILALPTYFLINPDGVIIEKWLGYHEGIFEEKLTKHIEILKF
jgi:thiol-disulfide isomerase/thioredoxin